MTHYDRDGNALVSVGTVQDITVQKEAEEKLRIASIAFETQEAIVVTDAQARIISVNKSFERLTGYSAAEAIGQNPRILQSGRHGPEFYSKLWASLNEHGTWSGEMWDKRKDGTVYPKWLTITSVRDEAGEITHYVAIFMDISERKRAEEEIQRLAFYDTLTELPNRRLLMDRLIQSLIASERSGSYGALLFMDMDNFKILNDTQGHDVGDMLLIEVANRLKSSVRESDTVARLGGDEFVVILQGLGSSELLAANQAEDVAEKIVAALGESYLLGAHEHHSSVSIGVGLFHGRQVTVDELLKRADTAMYQAKSAGRNAVRFFETDMQKSVESRAMLEKDLRQALAREELLLYYQMQVNNKQQIIGAEVLLRWINPERGFVSPAQFIPLAEESGLILPIGLWVLETACGQLRQWQDSPATRHLQLAVNVSARQFRQPNFVAQVGEILEKQGIDPTRLKLELTESVVLTDVEETVQKMLALKRLGVQFSMDDFGTGYSSLSYLKQLPLDQIKIDQSFVRDIVTDKSDAIIVKTIIDMSINFNLEVIAEGVETGEQLEILRQNGCQAFQGYLFGKAVPLTEFESQTRRSDIAKPNLAGRFIGADI
jgi:diguanylate cyclase (GGDEF)-like protein/PAS domain S-box-containing protein